MEHNTIIVYRNPLEAAIWDSLMGGGLFPLLAGLFVAFIVGLTVAHFCEWLAVRFHRFRHIRTDIITVVVAVASMLLTTIYLK